jgi:hypothetical protein
VLLSGCGAPAGTPTIVPSIEPSPNGPTPAEPPSPDYPSLPATPPGPTADPALAALFPTSVGGHTLEATLETGREFLEREDDEGVALVQAMLGRLGRTVDDLTFGWAVDVETEIDLQIFAFQVRGVPAARLLPEVVAYERRGVERFELSSVEIAGRAVTLLTEPDGGGGGGGEGGEGASPEVPRLRHFLGVRDVVFELESEDPALVEEAIRQLPRDD